MGNVPVLRFSGFSGDWEHKKLNEIGSVKTGPFGSLLHEKDYVPVGTPIITVEHLNDLGIIHHNLPLVSDEDKNRLKSFILENGDIVFSRVGSVDRNSIITEDEDGWLFSGRLLRIRTIKKVVFSKFLSFSFQQEFTKYRIRSVAVGQTMPSLNTMILKSFVVAFPPSLPEQQKIATFLSAVDKKLGHLRRKHELLESYKRGIMQKIFSQELRFKQDNGADFPDWEEKRLGDVAEKYYQGVNTAADGVVYEKTGFPIIQAKHITSERLDYTDARLVGVNDYEKYKGKYNPDVNDILISNIGTLGKVVIVEKSKQYLIAWNIFIIKLMKENILPEFIFNSLRWISSRGYFERMKTGNATKFVNKSDMLAIDIALPCIEEQQKIATFLSTLDKKLEAVQKQIDQTEVFKKGLLQKMFV